MSGYAAARLDEIEQRDTWIPIREHLGIRAFGTNAYRAAEAGADVIGEHTELMAKHEELYVVLHGHATFTVAGDEIDAPAGTLVFVSDPGAHRKAVAREPGTTVLAVGAKPGEAFEVSPWEQSWREGEEAMALYREQRYAEAAGVLREAVGRYPQSAGLHYNLACFDSMAGAGPEAVAASLRRSIELFPGFRDYAREDSDLDPVRGQPPVKELLEAAP
jgi:mannose-6-phosphate isomerase-like protein (cupin superfamily)